MGDLGSWSGIIYFVLFVDLRGLRYKGAIYSFIWWFIFFVTDIFIFERRKKWLEQKDLVKV